MSVCVYGCVSMRICACMFERMNEQRCECACIENVEWNKKNRIPILILEIQSEASMLITCLIIIRNMQTLFSQDVFRYCRSVIRVGGTALITRA